MLNALSSSAESGPVQFCVGYNWKSSGVLFCVSKYILCQLIMKSGAVPICEYYISVTHFWVSMRWSKSSNYGTLVVPISWYHEMETPYHIPLFPIPFHLIPYPRGIPHRQQHG